MLKKRQLKQYYAKFQTHFNLKDFVGFTALIFGLLLSNSSFHKEDHTKTTVSKAYKTQKPTSLKSKLIEKMKHKQAPGKQARKN